MIPHSNTSNDDREESSSSNSKAHSSYYNSYSIPSLHPSPNSLGNSFGINSNLSNNLLSSISNANTSNSEPSSSKVKVSYFDRYPERKNQGPYVLDTKLTSAPSSSRRRERERGKEKEKDKAKSRESDRESHKRSNQTPSASSSTTTSITGSNAVNSSHGERREDRERKERERERTKDRSIGRKEAKEISPQSTSSLGHGLGISSVNLATFSNSPSSTSTDSGKSSSSNSKGEDRSRTYSIVKHREQANAAAFKSPSGYPSAPSSLTKRHSKRDLKSNGSPSSNSEGGNVSLGGFSSSSETPPTISEERFNSNDHKTPKSNLRLNGSSSTLVSPPPAQMAIDAKLYAALKKDLGISSNHEPTLRPMASSSSSRKLRSEASSSSTTSNHALSSHGNRRDQIESSTTLEEPKKQIKKSSSRGNGLSKSTSSTSTSNPNNDWGESELSTSGSNFLSSLSRSYSSSNSLNPIPDISPSLPFPRSPSGPSPESSPSKPRFYSTQTSSTPISNSKYKQREEPASPTKVRSGQKREMEKESCNLDLNSSRTTTMTMTRLEAPKTSSTSQSSSSPRSEDRRLSTYSGYSLSSTGTASSYGEPLSPTPFLVQVDTSWWDGDENQDREMLGRKDSKGSYSKFQSNSNHHLSASNSKPTPATYAASSAAMGKSRSSHSSSASSKLKTEYVPSIEDILRSHSKLPSGKDQFQRQKAGSSGSRIGAISPNSFDLYSSSIKSIPSSPPSRESSIHEGFTGSSSSSSNGAAQSHRSNRMYQANGNGMKTANSTSTSNPQGSWGSRSMKSRHGPIPEYSELKSQSLVTSTRDSDQDLEPSEDSDDESISSADSIEREIRQSLRNERRKNKNILVVNRPPIGARSLSASVDTNPTSVSGNLDADRSRDSSSPVAARNSSKALHHSTSFPNRKILSKNSKAPPSPLELTGISSFATPQPASRSKLLGKGVASAGRASPSAPPIRRRAVSTASTSSSAAAAAASSPSSQAPLPSLEDGSTVAHYLRSAKLTRLLKLVRDPNEGLTVSVADVGAPNGHPVVIFLGLGAVRYLVALYEDMAAALDLRLICIDRWGLGRTTDVPPEKRGVLDWASVVDEVTSQLGIDRFSVLAHSAGAPYAMATVLLYPNKIAGPVHLLAPWVNSTHEGGYKWLKYVPDTVIRTAQAAEWKMQGWKLGKNPSLSYEAVGSDGIRSNEGLGTPNSDSFDNSSLDVENQNSLEVLSSPALTSCSSSGPSPTSATHLGSSTSSNHSSSFSPQASLVETPSANRSTKTLKGKPSFLGGIFNAKHSGHSHSNSNPSARLHMDHSSSQSSLASPLASQDSDPSNHWSKSPFVPSKDPSPVGLVGRAASTEIPRPSLAEDLNLTSALFRFTDLDNGRSSSSVDGHTISGSLSLSSGLDSSIRGIGSEPTSIRRSISTSATGLPRLPFESSSSVNAMPVRSASTNAIENSSSISIDPSNSSLGSNVFITPQMKQGGWINSSSPQRPSPQGSSFGNHSSSSNKSTNGFPSTPSSVGTPVNKAAISSHQSSTSNTPTSINTPADLTTALLRASHAESLKGGTADLMTILGRGAKPWGFTFSDVQHPVKVWHGDRDERISLTGVMWMEREMENCEVKIVKGAGHGLMTNVGVFVEALESIVDTKRT